MGDSLLEKSIKENVIHVEENKQEYINAPLLNKQSEKTGILKKDKILPDEEKEEKYRVSIRKNMPPKLVAVSMNQVTRSAFSKVAEHFGDNMPNIWTLIETTRDNKEDDSVTYRQLRDAGEAAMQLANRMKDGGDLPDSDEIMEVMMRLSETANAYYDTHRGHRTTTRGSNRKAAVKTIRTLARNFYDEISKKAGGEGFDLGIKRKGPMPSVEEGVASGEKLAELAKYWKKWRKHFAKQEGDERGNIRDKAALFEVYRHEIEVYKATHFGMEWPDEIAEVIREATFYKLQNDLINGYEKHSHTYGAQLWEFARKHTDKMDYREKAKHSFKHEEIDVGLNKEQLMGVEDVDRWFIRNYNNGGYFGRILGIRKHNGQIVSTLMSKTKRERLFIYYLIETGKRKTPELMDAFMSQENYTPNIDRIKKQMMATKWKFLSHASGQYMYMFKLTEAMQINREYQDIIRDCSSLINMKVKKNAEPKDPGEKRTLALKKAYDSTKLYRQTLIEIGSEKDTVKKKELKVRSKQLANQARNDIRALVEADNEVAEAVRYNAELNGHKEGDRTAHRANNDIAAFKENVDFASDKVKYAAKNASTFVNSGIEGINALAGSELVSWNLKESGLMNVKLFSETIGANTIAGLGSVMALLIGIYTINKSWDLMHGGDKASTIINMASSLAGIGVSIAGSIELGRQYANLAENFVEGAKIVVTPGLTVASYALGGVGVAMGAYNSISKYLDTKNADKAKELLNNRKKHIKLEDQEDLLEVEDRTAKEKKEKEKQKREKYEKQMADLSELISTHNLEQAALGTLSSISGMMSVCLPGLGTIVFGGLTMLISITNSIVKAISLNEIREVIFDAYFGLNAKLMQKVEETMAKTGRKIYDKKQFKKNLRRILAAAIGFADPSSAMDQIAKRYAMQVRGKLFGIDRAIDEDEREAYIQMIKSFGLKYDEEKEMPPLGLLARKMSGR